MVWSITSTRSTRIDGGMRIAVLEEGMGEYNDGGCESDRARQIYGGGLFGRK